MVAPEKIGAGEGGIGEGGRGEVGSLVKHGRDRVPAVRGVGLDSMRIQ